MATNQMKTNILEESEILNRVEGDEELLVELIEIFLSESDSLVSDILDATAHHDGGRLERAAHKCKSSMSLFGGTEAAESASALEQIGRSQNWTCASTASAQFRDHMHALVTSLVALKERHAKSSAGG
jgi:histidine phosphotransfer protein HptB